MPDPGQERKALEFYAETYNYVPGNGGYPSAIERDEGMRARAALAARGEPLSGHGDYSDRQMQAIQAAAEALRGIYPNEFADDFYFYQQAKGVIDAYLAAAREDTERPTVRQHEELQRAYEEALGRANRAEAALAAREEPRPNDLLRRLSKFFEERSGESSEKMAFYVEIETTLAAAREDTERPTVRQHEELQRAYEEALGRANRAEKSLRGDTKRPDER